MRTYEVKVNHYPEDSNEPSVEHTHRVQMPHKVWLDLKGKYGTAIWPFHNWVEKRLKLNIGDRYHKKSYKSRYYIKSCKLVR